MLIIVENLPLPFDRRVWQEARTLHGAGYQVSIICPKGKGYEKSFEELDGVAIYRHSMPFEASGALGYALEYSWALAAEFCLVAEDIFRPRLRRHSRLQSARHDFSDRRFLQAVRQEIPVRPPRHQSRAVRGEVSAPRYFLPPDAGAGALDVSHRRRLRRHQRVLPPDRDRARRTAARQGVRGAQWPGPAALESAAAASGVETGPQVPGRLCRRDGAPGRHRSCWSRLITSCIR